MAAQKVDGVSLRKAIQNFGSLEKAIAVQKDSVKEVITTERLPMVVFPDR